MGQSKREGEGEGEGEWEVERGKLAGQAKGKM